jgi:hypothetical protein
MLYASPAEGSGKEVSVSRYGATYIGAGTQGQVTAERTSVILDPIAYDSRLREALQLLAEEFSDGRTPIADEAEEQKKLDELLAQTKAGGSVEI